MAKVYSPNRYYTGISATVMFVNGVGETSDPRLLDWFRKMGYQVADDPVVPEQQPADDSESETVPTHLEPATDSEPAPAEAAYRPRRGKKK